MMVIAKTARGGDAKFGVEDVLVRSRKSLLFSLLTLSLRTLINLGNVLNSEGVILKF
jgi:hypothetical protein